MIVTVESAPEAVEGNIGSESELYSWKMALRGIWTGLDADGTETSRIGVRETMRIAEAATSSVAWAYGIGHAETRGDSGCSSRSGIG